MKVHQSKPWIKEFYRAGTAPPRFEIPGSAPGNDSSVKPNKACLEPSSSLLNVLHSSLEKRHKYCYNPEGNSGKYFGLGRYIKVKGVPDVMVGEFLMREGLSKKPGHDKRNLQEDEEQS